VKLGGEPLCDLCFALFDPGSTIICALDLVHRRLQAGAGELVITKYDAIEVLRARRRFSTVYKPFWHSPRNRRLAVNRDI